MQVLDIHSFPLQGQSLIEASAGTGKTYTIASLYSRLLLGHTVNRLACHQLLVVTFTNAATEELRGRIRERIRQMTDDVLRIRAVLGSGDTEEIDAVLACINPDMRVWLNDLGILKDVEALGELTDWLNTNLSQMDNASIYTIHGFCQRMLKQFAFDSGVMFSAELLLDTQTYLRQSCEDVWRNGNYRLSAEQVGYLLELYPTPDALQQQVRQWLSHAGLTFLPELVQDTFVKDSEMPVQTSALQGQHRLDFGNGWAALKVQYQQLAKHWQAVGDDNITTLIQVSDVNKRSFNKKNLPRWVETVSHWLASGFSLPMPAVLDHFGQRNLHAKTKSGKQAPEHPLFVQVDAFIDEERRLAVGLPQIWFERVKQRYYELLTQAGALSPDDLLRLLDEALQGAQGDSLASQIRALYPVALIDEFQDTDPLQYRIFSRIYQPNVQEQTPSGEVADKQTNWALAAIGDPKQAIYAFRGADIFTYIGARRELIRLVGNDAPIFTLDTNWRSHSQLVEGVNALFSQHPEPFLFDQDIPFFPVKAAAKHDHKALTVFNQPVSPLQLWLDDDPCSLPQGRIKVARQCAQQIRAALDGAAQLNGETVTAADMAVLVRSHQQAEMMREALAEQGVGSVFLSRDSVLASREARDLLVWLKAVAEPADERAVRRAMASETQGFVAQQLDILLNDEQQWESRLEQMASYLNIWQHKGIMAALMRWLEDDGRAVRLRQLSDGERRLTNILHLGEMLQQSSRKLRGHLSLLRWFTEQVLGEASAVEEAQLRLETDANLVSIVTIHKSKGLEYPMVFLPFLWSDDFSSQPSKEARYFDDRHGVVVNLEPDDAARQAQYRDNQAEAMRLLYVALTRPVQGCFIWLTNAGKDIKKTGWKARIQSSALGRLLQLDLLLETVGGNPQPRSWCEQLKLHWQAHDQQLGHASLMSLPDWRSAQPDAWIRKSGIVAVEDGLGSRSEAGSIRANVFRRSLSWHWRVSSFSQLSAHHHGYSKTNDPISTVDEIDQSEALLRTDDDLTGGDSTFFDVVGENRPAGIKTRVERIAMEFPRGATAGTCLHAMMELWDFSDLDLLEHDIVPSELQRYGLELQRSEQALSLEAGAKADSGEDTAQEEFRSALAQWLRQVVETPLCDDFGNQFTLSELDHDKRLDEMEFCLPVGKRRKSSSGVLRNEVLNALLSEQIVNKEELDKTAAETELRPRTALTFEPLSGYLKGFIDLIFCHNGRYYILDYKSNWLGESITDYQTESLHQAMTDHHYDLQAWIYTLALDQLLSNRLPDYDPETHLGGAFYLFMRGMTGSPPLSAQCGEQTDLFAKVETGQCPGVYYQSVKIDSLKRWQQVIFGDAQGQPLESGS